MRGAVAAALCAVLGGPIYAQDRIDVGGFALVGNFFEHGGACVGMARDGNVAPIFYDVVSVETSLAPERFEMWSQVRILDDWPVIEARLIRDWNADIEYTLTCGTKVPMTPAALAEVWAAVQATQEIAPAWDGWMDGYWQADDVSLNYCTSAFQSTIGDVATVEIRYQIEEDDVLRIQVTAALAVFNEPLCEVSAE